METQNPLLNNQFGFNQYFGGFGGLGGLGGFGNLGFGSLDFSWLNNSFLGGAFSYLGPFAAYMSQSYLFNMIALWVIGIVVGWTQAIYYWAAERVKYQLTVTAHIYDGDPAYEWIVTLLTEENIWHRSCEYQVSAKSSARKRGINSNANFITEGKEQSIKDEDLGPEAAAADYIPSWTIPQVFRWKGYFIEVTKNGSGIPNVGFGSPYAPPPPVSGGNSITLRIYSLRMSVLAELIEEAKRRYVDAHKPHVIIHTYDGSHGGGPVYDSWGNPTGNLAGWGSVKQKPRRPTSSVVLPEGVMNMLVEDARDFLETEDWYHELGIPHRRGYLLYGPPGTGKTSTIYSLAGELGLEIFSLSLASGILNDSSLQTAVNATPKRSILLIEDIDCAFPVRREDESDSDSDGSVYSDWGLPPPANPPQRRRRRKYQHAPPVTMSGLLNVLDGVGSDEGKIFFATTNYVDRLDGALIRPGRIDRKIEYKLASQYQARSLFLRFFSTQKSPRARDGNSSKTSSTIPEKVSNLLGGKTLRHDPQVLAELATQFSLGVPENEFSTAQLQGYLLIHKRDPHMAAQCIRDWVQGERDEKQRKLQKELDKKERKKKKREERRGTAAATELWARMAGQATAQPTIPLPPAPQAAAVPPDTDGALTFTLSPDASTPAAIMPPASGIDNPPPADAPPVIPAGVHINGKGGMSGSE